MWRSPGQGVTLTIGIQYGVRDMLHSILELHSVYVGVLKSRTVCTFILVAFPQLGINL